MHTRFHCVDMYHMAYLENGQVYFYAPSPYVWQRTENPPDNLTDIAITQHGDLYVLRTDGHIYLYDRRTKTWQRESGQIENVRSIAYYIPNHWLLCTTENGTLWYCDLYTPPLSRQWAETQHRHIADFGGVLIWEYEVKPGDWLFKIVRVVYGTTTDYTKTSALVDQVVALNPGLNPDKIEPGQKLKMPPKIE